MNGWSMFEYFVTRRLFGIAYFGGTLDLHYVTGFSATGTCIGRGLSLDYAAAVWISAQAPKRREVTVN
jgi:hypothetical protein